jgi:FlaA1/EpsC-like NDP-sugar epimerase
MQLWRRTAVAVDVLPARRGSLTAFAATTDRSRRRCRPAAIDVSFILLVMHLRGRRVSQLQGSAIDGCVEALKVCSLGALLALATAAILGGDRPVPIGPELWVLTAVVMCGARLTMQVAQRRARRRGALMTPTLIVCEGLGGGHDVVRRLLDRPEHGLRPVGFLDADLYRERPTSRWASRCSAAPMTSSTCALRLAQTT